MKIDETFLNEFALKAYKQNCDVGWWDDPDRCLYTAIQLASTEIAEATEGDRKDLMDDKLQHRKMFEVELADAAIRILDFMAHLGLVYEQNKDVVVDHFWPLPEWSTGRQLLSVNSAICAMGIALREEEMESVQKIGSSALDMIMKIAEIHELDLAGAMEEKLEFNRTRPDHTRENRSAENGLKY